MLIYVGDVLKGDLGPSFANQDFTVTQQILTGLPYTLTTGGAAFVLATVVGVFIGCLGALYQNRSADYWLGGGLLIGLVMPSFLIAPILQLVFETNSAGCRSAAGVTARSSSSSCLSSF